MTLFMQTRVLALKKMMELMASGGVVSYDNPDEYDTTPGSIDAYRKIEVLVDKETYTLFYF